MVITKTNFINYIRCQRYVALYNLKKKIDISDMTLEEYKQQEDDEIRREIIGAMYDEEGNDLIDIENKQLETMMPYYKEVEILAGNIFNKKIPGKILYYENNFDQKRFDCIIADNKYLCYVDIYNKRKDGIDIIEVKATTDKKYLNLGKGYTNELGEKKYHSIFAFNKDKILKLREELPNNIFEDDLPEKDYLKHKAKLFDRYTDVGHYVYDLAVQRYIIENSIKDKKNIKYYLAVLNSEYVLNSDALLNQDDSGNDIITFIDLTNVTKDYMDKIKIDQEKITEYINKMDNSICGVGNYCEYKKPVRCKFCEVCFKLPKNNSILNYIDNHFGFKDETGNKHDRYELINEGNVKMLDIPKSWLTRQSNIIQRDCVEKNIIYKNLDKLSKGIKAITYPIYHLDFETFPCPIPRYKGEKAYMQSVFQFSLHIEREPGTCDKDKDHYTYLSIDHNDHREDLIKEMIKYIDTSKGTIMVYNQAFEKTRLKELGEIFPKYKKELNKMASMLFDLMYLVKTNTNFYKDLGYEEEVSKLFNYYHPKLNGSFSIKKVLPCFSDLSYSELEVENGMEALITYANFPNMDKDEYNKKYNALLEYCKQDTWAMVEILQGLRNLTKS
ncbi:MAG: DUF2779 domain-containing protein [Bacilli bacterium]